MLDRATDDGGEGPFESPSPREKPLPFIVLFEPLEMGGEANCPRLFGEYGESVSRVWYFEMPDHSLPPPIETGDKGPASRPFIVFALSLLAYENQIW